MLETQYTGATAVVCHGNLYSGYCCINMYIFDTFYNSTETLTFFKEHKDFFLHT